MSDLFHGKPGRSFAVLSATSLVLLLAAACQEDVRNHSPAAPAAATARIQGTIVSDNENPSLPPGLPIAGARITTDSGRSAVSSASGTFALDSVPAGTVRLTLESSGIRADLSVAAPPRGVVTVNVALSRRGAKLISHDDASEIEGLVLSVDAAGSMLTVLDNRLGSVTVKTNSSTVIRKGQVSVTPAVIKIGMRIHVKAARQADGAFLATEIVIQDEQQAEVEISGTIASLDNTSKSFVVQTPGGKVSVTTDGNTVFLKKGQGATFPDLSLGSRVEVKGLRQTDGSIAATRVQIENEADEQQEAEARGSIQSVDAASSSFILMTATGTVSVQTNGATAFRAEHDAAVTFADLKARQTVEAEGKRQPDGSILAKKVKIED